MMRASLLARVWGKQLGALGMLSALAMSCDGDVAAATEIVVVIDADDGIRVQATGLRIEVLSSEDRDFSRPTEVATHEVVPGEDGVADYPIRIALTPGSGREGWFVAVKATASGGNGDLASAQVLTQYLPRQIRYARLLIEDACVGRLDCAATETCRGGDCVDAYVDPSTLTTTPPERSDGGVLTRCTSNTACDDGVYCNGTETCDPSSPSAASSGCVAGAVVSCDDGVECTSDRCDEASRACAFVAPDVDQDGHGDAACLDANDQPLGDDCADDDAARFPGNPEVCDDQNVDEDCDPSTFGFKDDDGDGAIDAMCCNADADGTLRCGLDCDDADLAVHAKQPEFCDGKDNDCDDEIDEVENAVEWFEDLDMDGFGSGEPVTTSCTPQPGRSLLSNDCDDDDVERRPNAPELCDDVDNNCNGVRDERLTDCATSPEPGAVPPINECVNGLDDCVDGARCTDTSVAFTCSCPSGYVGTGRGDDGCEDENECTTDNGGCDTDPMATCEDQEGAPRTCACPSGYSGTGIGADGCVMGDPCLTNNGGCDTEPRASCTNNPGAAPTCACPQYYEGTGVGDGGCSDVDECATNNGGCGDPGFRRCSNVVGGAPSCTTLDLCAIMNGGCDTTPMASCAQTGGSTTCTCPSGYTTTDAGVTCTDVDECATNNGGCGSVSAWTCANNPGAPATCTDINECTANSDNCHANATCTNTTGSFTCMCNSGYTGSGVSCALSARDECTLNEDDCDNSPDACVDDAMGFHCTCPGTHFGNGVGSNGCVPCASISNCASGLSCTTGSNQTCGTCAPGYVGDGTGSCTPCGAGTYDNNNACVSCGNISNCAAAETCNFTNGSGLVCPTCAAGYRGNGTGSCTACTAIANCASGLSCTTSSNQTCGTCAAGYVGDSTGSCTPCGTGTYDNNNTCVTCGNIANCAAAETCNFTNGTNLVCPTCAAGYRGNGTGSCTACTAIANCASGLSCTTGSNQTCGTCASGYQGNGTGACTDINECLMSNGGCDTNPLATCTNQEGAPNTCSCPAGTTGSGVGASGCVCNAVAACDAGNEMNGSYCSNGTTLQTCAANGVGCQQVSVATCAGGQACVGTHPSARCASEETSGFPNNGGASTSWTGLMVGVRINIPVASNLRRFGLVWDGNGSGGALARLVTFGLYADGGSGPSGSLLASALDRMVSASDTPYEFTPTAGNGAALPAGDYWVFVNINATGYVARASSPSTPYLYATNAYGSGFPGSVSPATFQSGNLPGPLNFFLVAMPQQ